MATTKKPDKPAEVEKAFMYLGPSIRGYIQTGTIYRGTMETVKAGLSAVIEKYPDVERLIVPEDELIIEKSKMRNGEGSRAAAYRRLANRR